MAKKIAMGIMATIIVVFFGLSAYKSFFGQEKEPEKPKVDIFKNAMEKVDIVTWTRSEERPCNKQ